MKERLTASEVNQAITSGTKVCLLDVRTPAEYESAHVDGSVLMPLDQLDTKAAAAAAEGAGLRVVLCQGGIRAAKALAQLQAAGTDGWTVLDGGVNAWKAEGLPLVHGKFTLPLERQVFIIAGFMALVGVVLGFALHPGFFVLSGFVGFGLMVAGFTGFCPMGLLLARMPWNQRGGSCCAGSGGCCGSK